MDCEREYFSIVRDTTVLGKRSQEVVLNIGHEFDVPKELWPGLIRRIKVRMAGEHTLFQPEDTNMEHWAEKLATDILQKEAESLITLPELAYKTRISVKESLTAGVAHASLFAMESLSLDSLLLDLGFSSNKAKIAQSLIASRMEHPESDFNTYKWLCNYSALGPMLNINFKSSSHMALYRISDMIYDVKADIEDALFKQKPSLFKDDSFALFDLTNTYFEGHPLTNKAKRGFSKEKRSDCLLISIAAIVDLDANLRKIKFYPGNVSECSTMVEMITETKVGKNTKIGMDRGIATADNINWLQDNGYKYLVVNREMHREFDFNHPCQVITSNSGEKVNIYREEVDIIGNIKPYREARLFCHSEARQDSEEKMNKKNRDGFEKGIAKLNDKIINSNKFSESQISRQIGKMDHEFKVSKHYKVEIIVGHVGNSKKTYAQKIICNYDPLPNSKMTHPGIYNLRTNDLSLSDTEIWEGFIKQNKVESLFRSLKSELGLRPIYHHTEERIEGHLFISALAYHFVNWLRKRMEINGLHKSWKSILEDLKPITLSKIITKSEKGTDIQWVCNDLNDLQKQIYQAMKIYTLPSIKSLK